MPHSKLVANNRPWVRDVMSLLSVTFFVFMAVAFGFGWTKSHTWPALVALGGLASIAMFRSGLWVGQPLRSKLDINAATGQIGIDQSADDVVGRIGPGLTPKSSSEVILPQSPSQK